MNGKEFLIDTNVIIHHLSGNTSIEAIITGAQLYISAITYIELLASSKISGEERISVETYINHLTVVQTNEIICNVAIDMRRNYRIKLADAIIAATCFFLNIPLLTYDSDFARIDDLRIIKLDL
jgi:predicted nucleic acid-binding protein